LNTRTCLALALTVTFAIGLSACGRRGALEVPTRAGAPTARPAENAPPTTFSPGGSSSKPKVVVPSKEPFVLDPLL
jgi:predicted small lipoprotein YifL